MNAAVLLIVMSASGSPQFILPQPDMQVCRMNAALMDRMLDKATNNSAECWDQLTQAFMRLEHRAPSPPGDRID